MSLQTELWIAGDTQQPDACQRAALGLVSGSRLLAPLREAVDRCQRNARSALDAMSDDAKETWAWDSCEDAIDRCELRWLADSLDSVRGNIWDAEGRREGYDTWPAAALRKHIAELQALSSALTALVSALRILAAREAEELSANGADQPRPTNAKPL